MPTFRSVIDDLVTLAAGRDDDPHTYAPSAALGGAPTYAALASAPDFLAPANDASSVWGGSVISGAAPAAAGIVDLAMPVTSQGSDARNSGLEAEWIATAPQNTSSSAAAAPGAAITSAGVDLSLAASAAAAAPSTVGPAAAQGVGISPLLTINQAALATTEPQQIDFSGTDLPVFGSDTSFSFSLPSVLYKQYGFSTGVSVAGFGLNASVSIAGGIKGSVALSLGQFSPDFALTIDPGVIPFVQDGQVFSVDPSLISTDDASFSLSLPEANASLDFGLQAKAGLTFSFPTVPIGFSLPYVGFIGYHLHIPSEFVGFQVGSIFKLKSSTNISIGGVGTVTLTELQSSVVNSGTVSNFGGLPTLEMSGDTAPFFAANVDLLSILVQKVPDPFAVLQGSKSFGIAKLGYKFLSLPLTGSLWLHEDVTLTPIGITETVEDMQNHVIHTGTLGQSFDFTAPSSGNGTVPLSITFGLELSVHTEIDLDGNIELTEEGPSVSASIAGLSKTIGPLGNFNLFDIQGEIAELYSNTTTETLTQSATVDLQNFASAVSQTVTSGSGMVDLTQPATDLVVASTATVTGGAYGVLTGTLSAAMVTDAGLITATGIGVELQEGGSVYVEAGGRITGQGAYATVGVLAMGVQQTAVINDGDISGFLYGVRLVGGMVENATGAVISGSKLGVELAGAGASIVNNGTISSATGAGVELAGGGVVYNAIAGYIRGGAYGVYAPGGAVSVENHCTLTGGASAVRAMDGGSVTNLAGAYLHGGGAAVIIDGGSSELVSNQAGATISGGKIGASLTGANVTVVDYGTISGSLASVELYGTSSNTLVLDPQATLSGGVVRFSAVQNYISLTAGSGGVGTITGLGAAEPFTGTIDIGNGAAWDISGDLNGDVLGGLSAGDTLTDTGIVWKAGERAEVDNLTGVIGIFVAGKPNTPIGTIQVAGYLEDAPILSDGAGGKLEISFDAQKLSAVTANNGQIYMGPSGFFGPNVTIAAGVTVSANYYGANRQSYGVFANQQRATLTNYGVIEGNNMAVELFDGGEVTNEAGATISATTGVELGSDSPYSADTVTLSNAGVITATSYGVLLGAIGTVTNLSGGQIISSGLNAVAIDENGWVLNQGTMSGARHAVRLFAGGLVYNETAGLLKSSQSAVDESGAYGKVINCGLIEATVSSAGVYLGDGGLVMNEAGGVITGVAAGVQITGAAGTIGNAGTINGVLLADGGMIVNGPTGTISAVAGYGVSFYNAAGPVAAYMRNKGLIAGVLASADDTIVNDGTIDGVGVVAGAAGGVTVTNSGDIQGSGGAVLFSSASDRLIVESGAMFIGAVKGGGGVLELGGGTGAISGLGGAGKLSGAAGMSFSGFGGYAIDAGATWTLEGAGALASGDSLSVAGTLTLAGTLTNRGVISGAKGSKIVLRNGDIAGGTLSSAGVVDLLDVDNLLDGTKSALTNEAAISIGNGTALTVQGAIVNGGSISLAARTAATRLIVGAAGATLSGAGSVVLGASTFDTITGATAAATLTNQSNLIRGSGQLGAGTMTLVNAAAGVIEQTGAVALVVNTGANTIANAGLIEAAGAGGMTIDSGVNNSGTLEAVAGTMTFAGAVGGAGRVIVRGGRMVFDAADGFTGGVDIKAGILELAAANAAGSGAITFAPSATGSSTLQLDASATPFAVGVDTFADKLVNFGANGFIDIKGMTYAAGATVTLNGDLMTVSSGGQTVNFTLAGTLPSLLLVVANDGGGVQVNTEGISTQGELNAAILAADQTSAGAGVVKLLICGDIDLSQALASIDLKPGVSVDIEGSGLTVNGPGAGLDVAAGAMTMEDLTFDGPLSVARGCDFSGYGVIGGAVANNGQIKAEGGVLTLQGPVDGAGEIVIGKGADLVIGAAVGQAIDFGPGGGETLSLAAPAQATGRIIDMSTGDKIDLVDIKATSLRRDGALLAIYDGGQLVASLDLTGPRQVYSLASDGAGGTEITATPWTGGGNPPNTTSPTATPAPATGPSSPTVEVGARFLQFAASHLVGAGSGSPGAAADVSWRAPMLASP